MSVCIYTYIYIYTYVDIYTMVYVYIYIYTIPTKLFGSDWRIIQYRVTQVFVRLMQYRVTQVFLRIMQFRVTEVFGRILQQICSVVSYLNGWKWGVGRERSAGWRATFLPFGQVSHGCLIYNNKKATNVSYLNETSMISESWMSHIQKKTNHECLIFIKKTNHECLIL